MLRNIAAILLLVVFFSLQFGKVAGYLYCKWQAEVVKGLPDCGCEDQLATMFDHHDDKNNTDTPTITLNEKLTEFPPRQQIDIPPGLVLLRNNFSEYHVSLADGYKAAPFHPPSI